MEDLDATFALVRRAAAASPEPPPPRPSRGVRCTLPRAVSRLSLLVDLASLAAREVDLDALLRTACERMAEALHADRATVWLVDAERQDLVTRVALLPEAAELRQPLDRGLAGWVARTGELVRVDDASADPRFDPTADRTTGYRTRSVLVAALREGDSAPVRGVVQLLNRVDGPFDEEDARYVTALARELARVLAFTTLRPAVESEPGLVLRGPFNHVVGRSAGMVRVYERIQLAARTDATVLLTGETGTGKGLLARAVHVNSARQAGPLVTVDCTTLPAQLVESELFGHERGAYTGADRRVRGRVELAHGGTLFIDEIGELPLELQGKLLRFLQERQFERVGGRETLVADARVVAATHRDLGALARAGRFREDLLYRVRVVEIGVPALRDRGAAEILALARHFADAYARRYERPPLVFDEAATARLVAHAWPGNVRELEHWVESAVVLSPRGELSQSLLPPVVAQGEVRAAPGLAAGGGAVALPLGLPLDAALRRYVEATLEAAQGNRTEAARRLGVGRNTLARWLGRRAPG
ncbi:MAG: sigma-54-dependent Fis family transcriptional regulator [Polyangiaceae bacterium]|nr:sigma-54-dependent Fis family transcriptional regulator [Polyangiaceae bacterium]